MSQEPQYTHSLAPGTELKDYRIESVLGKGGFGITYLAEDIRLKKKVAIKELLPDGIATRGSGSTVVAQTSSQEEDFRWAIDSFLKEAQTLAGFEHPNIVRIYRLFEANDTAYMVMPFVEGDSLKEMVSKRKTLNYAEVKNILSHLLDGLEVVHRLDTLHRDIKPDNIIITKDGTPMLIDFGAARQTISGKTHDVTSIITPGYAAIEQYSTDARYQGPWSDIYALASVAYYMITGKQPVPASERNDAQRNMQPDPLPKLADLAPAGYPQQFLHAIDTALQMAEQLRPQCIADWRTLLAEPSKTMVNPSPASSMPPVMPGSQTAPPSANTAPVPLVHAPKKPKSKALLISICSVVALLLVAGGITAWKLIPNDDNGGTGADVSTKLTKIETFLDVKKPLSAKELIDEIDRSELATADAERYDSLSKQTQDQIANASNTVSISITPSFAQTELDGEKCKLTNGELEVKGLGSHTLRIFADGYQARSINFECEEIGGRISLSKVELEAQGNTRTITELINDLESALKQENLNEVSKLSEQLAKSTPPSHLKSKADDLLKQSEAFITKFKWRVTLKTNPPLTTLYLDKKRVYLANSTFRAETPGAHNLEISAAGYVTKTVPFTMSTDGKPLDLGTVTLEKSGSDDLAAKIGITQETAILVAKKFILAGNNPNQAADRTALLNDLVFYGNDQKNRQSKADLGKMFDAFYKRWKTRKYTIVGEVKAQAHSQGGSWVVSVPHSIELNDGLFTLKAKRDANFAILKSGGKPVINAYKEFMLGDAKDETVPNNTAIVSNLKAFNQARLVAGDTDGGESATKEASYYSNNTEYYGPKVLTRQEILQRINATRRQSGFRAYLVKSYSDFLHLTQSDPTGYSYSFKCVVEVTSDNGKTTRTEHVKVKYINGIPYVTSVRY
ncbi:hypothetical protein NT6N_19660 [Oceaniferula spumae]|uniref:Protein kinase domain-containing protein n=1 Tax=Oceaniferula spumae TaxID=2979115 RepID=A0AAT9FLP7_9BACT